MSSNHLLETIRTMGTVIVKKVIECDTCGCKLRRSQAFTTEANTKEEAIAEVQSLAAEWAEKLKGQNCKVCQSMYDEIERESKQCS